MLLLDMEKNNVYLPNLLLSGIAYIDTGKMKIELGVQNVWNK